MRKLANRVDEIASPEVSGSQNRTTKLTLYYDSARTTKEDVADSCKIEQLE